MFPWLLLWHCKLLGEGQLVGIHHIWVLVQRESHLWPCHSHSWTLDLHLHLGALQVPSTQQTRETLSPYAVVMGLPIHWVPQIAIWQSPQTFPFPRHFLFQPLYPFLLLVSWLASHHLSWTVASQQSFQLERNCRLFEQTEIKMSIKKKRKQGG